MTTGVKSMKLCTYTGSHNHTSNDTESFYDDDRSEQREEKKKEERDRKRTRKEIPKLKKRNSLDLDLSQIVKSSSINHDRFRCISSSNRNVLFNNNMLLRFSFILIRRTPNKFRIFNNNSKLFRDKNFRSLLDLIKGFCFLKIIMPD